MNFNIPNSLFLAVNRWQTFICVSAIIFASFDTKLSDNYEPQTFLGRNLRVFCESILMAVVVEVMTLLTWSLHFALGIGMKEDGFFGSLYLIGIHFIWICTTMAGLKATSRIRDMVQLLFEVMFIFTLIGIALKFLLKFLSKISWLFFRHDGPTSPTPPTQDETYQNDLPYQSQSDVINDSTEDLSTNSVQHPPSGSFSYLDNYTNDPNMAGSFRSYPQNRGDIFTDQRSQTKGDEDYSRVSRAMGLQESHTRTLQTGDQGTHSRMLQTENHQGTNSRMLQTGDHQGTHSRMLQTENHQGTHSRMVQTGDHQGTHSRMLQTENHQGLYGRMLQTENYQVPHTRPLQTGDLQNSQNNQALRFQGPQDKTLQTRSLLDQRAEIKRNASASGAGGILRLSSSQENTQQSKGEIKNHNSNKISGKSADEPNVSSQGGGRDEAPVQNIISKTRSGLVYRSLGKR